MVRNTNAVAVFVGKTVKKICDNEVVRDLNSFSAL